jgi:hypothetical protein
MAQLTVWQRITEFFSLASTEIITRVRISTRRWRSSYRAPTNDWSRSDYTFWAKAYYGRAAGLELSGLLIKPIVSKLAAWTLGRAPKWSVDGKTSQVALDEWWVDHHPQILAAWRGALKQGDAFLVVNSDLSITLLPPDTVDPIVAEDDYSVILGWRVTQLLQHPDTQARMVVTDEYYAERRIHRIEVNGLGTQENTYPNLLGMLPIVHIANQVDSGETFGHAETEGLLPLLHRYGEVFDAAIEGNVLQGRPTPVLTFETPQDLQKFDDENADYETQTLPNGRTQRVKIYDVDLSQLLVASGAEFEYKSPGNFTADTAQLLEIMYYLVLQHSELPEFLFGNAVSSSKASTETQMPVFIEFIKARRGEMVAWLTQIAEIALAYLSLTTPRVRAQTPSLQWEALDQEDGTLTLETIKWAFGEGLLDELTALQLMPVELDDPDAVLAKAREEREERQEMAMQQMEQEAQIAVNNAPPVNEMTNGNGNGHVEKGQALAMLEAATVEWMREL